MGRNTWVKRQRVEDGDGDGEELDGHESRNINIGGKATIFMGKHDRLLIETPGGGGWGRRREGSGGEKSKIIDDSKYTFGWAERGSLAERAAAQAEF